MPQLFKPRTCTGFWAYFLDSAMSNENADSNLITQEDEAAEGKRDLRNAFLLCVLAVMVFRSFVVEPFKIPSSSMVPTLQKGDHIFVSKFDYGLSVPFTKWLWAKWSQPKRGDVIVFLYPRDESHHYIKRVLGIPGDKVVIEGRKILVNDQEIERTPVTDTENLSPVYGRESLTGEIFRELNGDHDYLVRFVGRTRGDVRGLMQWEVPEDSFFVMGDNRDDSYDSREWNYVPRVNIKGRARIVWLSLDLERAWGKLEKVRWARTFMRIR